MRLNIASTCHNHFEDGKMKIDLFNNTSFIFIDIYSLFKQSLINCDKFLDSFQFYFKFYNFK